MALDSKSAGAEEAAQPVLGDDGPLSRLHTTIQSALTAARDQLLDRSLRNKLISTNVASDRARQIRVFDELSDEVFGTLKTSVQMTFAPGLAARGGADQTSIALNEDQSDWAPAEGNGADENGNARRSDRTLQTRLTPEGLQKRLTSLFYEGQTIEEEQGVSVLFLALGFLEWREANHSDIPRFAPLILVPVELLRPSTGARFRLTIREDELFTNVSLQAMLREQDIRLPDLDEAEDLVPSAYFDAVSKAVGQRPGWRVHANEIVLGFFSFSKFLLWRDLDAENWPTLGALLDCELLKHVLLRDDGDDLQDTPVIADDEVIEEKFASAELIHITDADSSQAIAIQEAMAGKNLVIQGPPGTGKSQTITNIIAGAVKRGKRVLFVAEKMAALEVVHDRLLKANLGPLCLELHSRKASKQQVLAQIKEGREAAAPPAWSGKALEELDQTQAALRRHSRRFHMADAAALTPFEILGGISRWHAQGAPAPTFQLPGVGAWTSDQVEAARRRTQALSSHIGAAGPPCQHPWRGLGVAMLNELEKERLAPSIAGAATAAESLAKAASAAADILGQERDPALKDGPVWIAALAHLASRPVGVDALLADERLLGLTGPLADLADAGEQLTAIRERLAAHVRPEAWSVDWLGVRRTIAGQGRSLFRLLSSKYREAVGELRGVWQGGDLPGAHAQRLEVLDALIDGARLAEIVRSASTSLGAALGPAWREEATDWALVRAVAAWIIKAREFEPKIMLRSQERLIERSHASAAQTALSEAALAATSSFKRVLGELKFDRAVTFDGAQEGGVLISSLVEITRRWRKHLGLIDQWPPIRDDLTWLEEVGAADLAHAVFRAELPVKQIEGVLMLAVYEAMWARVKAADPEIERTVGDDLTGLVERFRRADRGRIRIAADEVRRAHVDRHPTGTGGAVGIIIQETKKARRLKPVRKLMEEAGEAIQRFKPVFLMSPLSVAQFLPPGRIEFDLLVIDEASQVRPADALGAIARCDQLIVVGDDRQLPPTNFFGRMVNDEDDPDEDEDDGTVEGRPQRAAVRDIESILNLCNRFPERMLRWHYRSEHPALIATSNRHFYEGRLMLPPSVLTTAGDGETGLVFHQVERGGYDRGKTARNELEAEEVAQAVLAHALNHHDLSLGIGAFSVAQRDAVRDRIDRLARLYPELDAFLKVGAHGEPVFVKNLENIQGDERDVIFISVGYGHFKDGRLTQQFGPVGRDGGERRLNVLITRARKRCEVFSSIVAEDIRIEGGVKPGVVALQAFLKLAKDGFLETAGPTDRSFDSDFEEAVGLEIEKLGFRYHPQVGMAGFFIDIGVLDPREPDRYLLGVECDGAAYHSSRYARDRDRLRQMILEKRGWKLHRIWSTDWFHRKGREVAKLKHAIEAALAGGSLPTAANVYDFEPELTLHEAEEPDAPGADQRPATDASRPGSSGLRPYEFAAFRERTSEPHLLPTGALATMVERIVRVEQPIHEEEVGRRLAHVCGLQRAGNRIQAAASRGLQHSRTQGRLWADGSFWSLAPGASPDPRSRADLDASEPVRKPEMISPGEFGLAAMIALRQNLALDHDELVTKTARLIGLARVGADVREAIETAIRQISDEVERDHMGRFRPKD